VQAKGYGRITAEDGKVLLVHFSGIALDGFRSLAAGELISFVWRGGVADHGRHVAKDDRLTRSRARRLGAQASKKPRICVVRT